METKKNLGKRALSLVLTLLTVLSLVPLSALSTSAADVLANSNTGLKPLALKSETAVKWIDRLDLSGEAQIFQNLYNTLVEAADNDGVDDLLIEDEYFNGNNSIQVAVIEGKLSGPFSTNDELKVALRGVATELSSCYSPYIRAVAQAFLRDYPEAFWLNGQIKSVCSYKGSGNSYSGYTYQVTFSLILKDQSDGFDVRATDYQNETAIKSAIATVNSQADTIVNAVSDKPIYKQLQYFNHTLTTTNEYNTSSNLDNIDHDCRQCTASLSGSIGTDGPVCESYAKAFKVLCDKAGIPCILVDGIAGGAHMWNYVQLDDSWYAVDVTWNDPKVAGISGAISGYEGEKYLLIGSETVINGLAFGSSRTIVNKLSNNGIMFINQPTLSANKFQCQHKNITTNNGFCSACGEYEPAKYNEAKNVYEISNAGQLYWYAQQLNANNAEFYAELTSDIIIPENAPYWMPINCNYAYFNGNYKTISGLKCIGSEKETYVGMFGNEICWYEISNLHITDSYFEGKDYVGAVVANLNNGGSITNCYVTNTTVKGNGNNVGTLVGHLGISQITNCYVDTDTLIGYSNDSYGSIENSYYLSETDDGKGRKTAKQFASGEVAYLLGDAYGQSIGTENYPVFGGAEVYPIKNCKDERLYSNTNNNIGHNYVDGKCTICNNDQFVDKLAGYTVSLADKIAVNFYMSLDEKTLNDANAKMVFTVPDTDSSYTVEVPVSEAVKNGSNYIFNCNVAAKEMTSVIKAQFITSNAESEVYEYSVQQYCQYIIENPEAYSYSDVRIVKSMLNYGASAQVYFNHSTNNLANNILSDDDKAIIDDLDLTPYASSVSGKESGVSFYGGALSLKGETKIKLYFEIDDSVDINTLPVTIDGKPATVTKKAEYYELEISNIPAHKLGKMFEVKIGGLTVNYGAFSYGYTALKTDKDSLKNIIKTLYTYALSVKCV